MRIRTVEGIDDCHWVDSEDGLSAVAVDSARYTSPQSAIYALTEDMLRVTVDEGLDQWWPARDTIATRMPGLLDHANYTHLLQADTDHLHGLDTTGGVRFPVKEVLLANEDIVIVIGDRSRICEMTPMPSTHPA